jgi:hypothetical protein
MLLLGEGMSDETGVELGVGVALRLEREDRADGIQVARHGEATLGLPRPELRTDVLDDGGLAEAGAGEARLAQLVRETEIEPGVVHEDDDLGLPPERPRNHPGEELPVERIRGKDLHDAHRGEGGHVEEQLGAGGAELRTAEGGDAQARTGREQVGDDLGRMLVAGMLAGHDEDVDLAPRGRSKFAGMAGNALICAPCRRGSVR